MVDRLSPLCRFEKRRRRPLRPYAAPTSTFTRSMTVKPPSTTFQESLAHLVLAIQTDNLNDVARTDRMTSHAAKQLASTRKQTSQSFEPHPREVPLPVPVFQLPACIAASFSPSNKPLEVVKVRMTRDVPLVLESMVASESVKPWTKIRSQENRCLHTTPFLIRILCTQTATAPFVPLTASINLKKYQVVWPAASTEPPGPRVVYSRCVNKHSRSETGL